MLSATFIVLVYELKVIVSGLATLLFSGTLTPHEEVSGPQ